MRVLFLNDTSLVGGAERCLLDLLATLGDEIEPLVACPPGPLAEATRGLGVEVAPVRRVTGSLRLHPVHTPIALAELLAGSVAVRRLAASRRIDLVHANTLRSGLVATAARRLGGPPVAAFVHDALSCGRVPGLVSRLIRGGASVLFANSAYSADRFNIAADDPRRRVVFNPVDLAVFDRARYDRAAARAGLGLSSERLVLAIVAQITPWKGQRDAIEILAALRTVRPDAHLLVVGEAKFVGRATRYDNQAYLGELRRLAGAARLEEHIDWLGERSDVADVLAAVDVLLVPSWHEPFGRVVVEGMAMGCLVAATARGGPAETIRAGVDGLLLEPRAPRRWARAIAAVLDDGAAVAAIRTAAPAAAKRFDRERFAEVVREGYRAALADATTGARSRP